MNLKKYPIDTVNSPF